MTGMHAPPHPTKRRLCPAPPRPVKITKTCGAQRSKVDFNPLKFRTVIARNVECFPHSLTFKSIIAIYVDVTDVIWRKLMRSCLRCYQSLKLVKCLMEVVFEMKIVVQTF